MTNPLSEPICVNVGQLPWGVPASEIISFTTASGESPEYLPCRFGDPRDLRVFIPANHTVPFVYLASSDYRFASDTTYQATFRLAGIPCRLVELDPNVPSESAFTPGVEQDGTVVLLSSAPFTIQSPSQEFK